MTNKLLNFVYVTTRKMVLSIIIGNCKGSDQSVPHIILEKSYFEFTSGGTP